MGRIYSLKSEKGRESSDCSGQAQVSASGHISSKTSSNIAKKINKVDILVSPRQSSNLNSLCRLVALYDNPKLKWPNTCTLFLQKLVLAELWWPDYLQSFLVQNILVSKTNRYVKLTQQSCFLWSKL